MLQTFGRPPLETKTKVEVPPQEEKKHQTERKKKVIVEEKKNIIR